MGYLSCTGGGWIGEMVWYGVPLLYRRRMDRGIRI